ncbi:MAG: glycine zipper 2TM domain-containing protein [Steroidobacteraceae bacterium]
MKLHRNFFAAATMLAITALAFPLSAIADPPPHAPAHGWRKKHDPYYVGYTGRHWRDDYGIRGGRCDRDRVGTALGAVVGGAIGGAISDGDDRLIAILAGATIGAIIGREIGEEMDDNDRACFGHSLELLDDGRYVLWDGTRRGMRYRLTPDGRFERDGRVCRHFTLLREYDGRQIQKRGSACRFGDGDWRMIRS